jgi:hypothetical protein
MFSFYSDCVNYPDLEDLNEIVDNQKEITLGTFSKHVDKNQFKDLKSNLGYNKGFKIDNDWSVTFHKSKDKDNNLVYFMCHSAIEYVFKKEL